MLALMKDDVDWARFVVEARDDVTKSAVLGLSSLPGWMLRALLQRPVVTGLTCGLLIAAFLAADPPADWWSALLLGAAFALPVMMAGLVLRRRVRAYLRATRSRPLR